METHAIENAKAWLQDIVKITQLAESEDDDIREQARREIDEGPLSVEVRSGWYIVGGGGDSSPEEYRILLSWGGPALQITGELDSHGEPDNASIEYQDWGTPWTALTGLTDEEAEAILQYARCFYYGE